MEWPNGWFLSITQQEKECFPSRSCGASAIFCNFMPPLLCNIGQKGDFNISNRELDLVARVKKY